MMGSLRTASRTIGALLCAAAVALGPVTADADHQRGRGAHRLPRWSGDIHAFREHDFGHWRAGHWYHGAHNGRLGWWWVLPGLELWYMYTAPIYPYPDPYLPPVVIQQVPAPTPAPAPSAPPPPAQYWYYCEPAKGYYPYVSTCPEAWKRVPAIPPGVQAP